MAEGEESSRIGARTWLKWTGLALLGICIAAAVSVAAGSLSSQSIGLTSEPVSAGDRLVPRAAFGAAGQRPAPDRRQPDSAPTPSDSQSRPAPASTPAPSPSTQAPVGETDLDGDD